jgi:hypothetical protein|eukprot:scaffold7969_cov295-Alexandrium_tamarense.AAC.4
MAIQRSNIVSNASSNSQSSSSFTNVAANRSLSPPPGSLLLPTSTSAAAAAQAAQFNPRLILSQIVALQSFHYLVLGFILQVNHVLFATSVTVDRIFTAKYLDLWTALGWVDNAAVLVSSLVG